MFKTRYLLSICVGMLSSNSLAENMELDCKTFDKGIESYAASGDEEFKRQCDNAYGEIEKRIYCKAHREKQQEARERQRKCDGSEFVERRRIIFDKSDLSDGAFKAEEQVEYCWGENYISSPTISVNPTTWSWGHSQLNRKTLTLKKRDPMNLRDRILNCELKPYEESPDLKI